MAKAAKLSAIDLNLLLVFDAVMRDRSVSRAGQRMGLSQPAMSHALGRLRHMLKDELFVRGPAGMTPTPRAEQLATPIRLALDGLQQALEPDQFDPAAATTTFRIAVDNYAAIVLVAQIAARVARIAPQVRLEFRPSGTLDVLDLLDRGELHLAIGPAAVQAERFVRRRLMQDQIVLVLRKGHPLAGREEIQAQQLATAAYLDISSAKFGAEFAEPSAHISRKSALRAPFLSAPSILATSDMVSALPLNVANSLTRAHQLVVRRLKPAPRPIESGMVWLRRLNNQPAHAWLRDLILQVAQAVPAA